MIVIIIVMMIGIVVAMRVIFSRAQPLFLGGVLGLFAQQGVTIRLRDLIIIGMDLAEREEPVAIAAIIDERRLERRFNASYLGEINITLELFMLFGLEIKFLDPSSLDDGDPSFLGVARVD